MSYVIKKEYCRIKINDKINQINKEDLIEIYCLIKTLIFLEKRGGNELDKAWIEFSYHENMLVKEYLNLFKLIRKGTYLEFIEYFVNINDRYTKQNTNTKAELDNYLEKNENLSQKIIIKMIFNIDSKIKEIEKRKEIIKKIDWENYVEIYNEATNSK